MPLNVGDRLGHYDVVALLGEGGMGQVWQATDTQLNRQVALKILPDAFATDPDRLARFKREAQILASLNHPNIAAIYGIEEAPSTSAHSTDGDAERSKGSGQAVSALVLELVEGPTLADRIKQGPIPLDEALPIAKQIAEALEAAHERGVIHRDLKPANVKVKDDGTVKVLDFGLAKAFQPDASDLGLSASPTISLTAAATQMGMVIGTAAYMAPEQAKGKVVDKRADVWAFGAVLYEMLTGQKPFTGRDVSDTLAAVLRIDADFDALPDGTPSRLRQVMKACLQKEPKDRVRDIGDVSLAMGGTFDAPAVETSSSAKPSRLQVWQRPLPALIAALLVAVVSSLAVWALLGSGTPPAPSPTRFTLTLPESDRLGSIRDMLALSPDGQTLVYRAARDGTFQLFRRPIDQFEATSMPGTETSLSPFFSPDGQWVGFSSAGALRKVALAGGPPQTLTAVVSVIRGADWGADDIIVYGLLGGPLMQVSSAGGDPTPLFTPDDGRRSWYPQILPGGDAVLFTLTNPEPDRGELHLVMRHTGEHRTLVPNAAKGRVLDTGHLVFVRGGALWAVGFDRERLDIVGTPAPVVEGVRVEGGGAVQYALADDGTLVYIPGGSSRGTRRLVWVDRHGDEEPLPARAANYISLSLSPDGARAAVSILDESGNRDVWVSELARGTLARLTRDDAFDGRPLWHPDGRRVAFRSDRNGQPELFLQAADGSGTAERLLTIDEAVTDIVPYDWSPDGATLFVVALLPETGFDVGMVSTEGPGTWEPLVQTAASEVWPAISPDGRWLAYASDETGRFEVYVQRFPERGGRQPISVGGGVLPEWSADGSELFYGRGGPPDAMMRVTITGDERDPPSLIVGTPERLFEWRYALPGVGLRHYDVSPDGQRFLMITPGGPADAGAGRAEINVVLDWFEELERLVPVP